MSNLVKEIKEHENEACNNFEFSEAIAIMREPVELTEKLMLAFTLGYMRATDKEKEALQ